MRDDIFSNFDTHHGVGQSDRYRMSASAALCNVDDLMNDDDTAAMKLS